MKINISKKIFELFKFRGVLAISGSLIMASCSTQIGAYTEMDGVYYDPEKDVVSESEQQYTHGNRVNETYDYYGREESAYEKSIKHGRYGSGRYTQRTDDGIGSDWGNYIGTETHYNSWGGYYSPDYWGGYGLGLGYGWGSYFRIGYNWGNPWYGYYNPYWGAFDYFHPYYNPYYMGYYSPYYYGNYYRVEPRYKYRRSGAVNTSVMTGNRARDFQNSGFRNGTVSGFSGSQRGSVSTSRPRHADGGFRNGPQVDISYPSRSYNTENRDSSGWRSGDSGGFRSSGYNNSSSSGTMRSGSSGGFRSGGFR